MILIGVQFRQRLIVLAVQHDVCVCVFMILLLLLMLITFFLFIRLCFYGNYRLVMVSGPSITRMLNGKRATVKVKVKSVISS